MAIQQYAYAFRSSAADSDSSSGLSLHDLNRRGRSCCRAHPRKKSITDKEKDVLFTTNQPFVTRSSATGQVTISVSLVGERKAKKPLSQNKKKNILLLPPIQSNQAKSNRYPLRKRVTFKKKKPPVNNATTLFPKLPVNEVQLKGIHERAFTVHYFPHETLEVKVEREASSRLSDDGITYAKLKHTTALSLRIEPTSLNFFGIFLGPLGNPRELCMDDAIIPGSIKEVCFQRLILVSEEEERYYLSKDDRALGLIFWELKDQYDRSQLIPLPSTDKSIEMERLLSSPNYTIGVKRKFVDLLLSFSSFYWSYYHKANYCTLQNSIWPNDYTTCKGTVVHLVPGREELIFLDVSGEVEIECLPWHRIRSLTWKSTPVMSIDFEIILVVKGQCLPHFISVITDCNKFLYSISIFMLRILQSRDTNNHILPPLDPFIAKYIQLQSEPDESVKKIILCSGEVAAIAFDNIDLTDDYTDKKFRNRYCFRGPIYFKSNNRFSFWKAYSDTSSEGDENENMDKHDLSGNDSEGKGDLCSTEPQNSVSIHKLLDENTFDNEDASYLIEENKKKSIDICYEDVSEDDFDYDNSADDELTDEEMERKKNSTTPPKSDIEDDNVFYASDESCEENLYIPGHRRLM